MARLRFSKKKTASRPAKTKQEDIFSKKNTVTIRDRELRVSPVLDTLFKWMAERHAIQQRRLAGESAPWTDDPIFQNNPFTNVFRVFDRVTQYILRHVVNEGDQDLHESCFRVILFRCFCRISTWELLQKHLGPLTWKNFDIRAYERVLSVSYQDGVSLYGSAYQMPAPDLGGSTAYENHLRLIKLMMDEDLPGQLGQVDELSDAYGRVSLFPGMGNFLAFQLVLDLNMIPALTFPENWSICGPGAQACLLKIFGENVRNIEGPALQFLHEHQDFFFARAGIPPARRPRISPRAPGGVSVVDLEHALCECEKYSRAAHPNIKGRRTSVSRKGTFCPSPEPITADLPCKWKLRVPNHARVPERKLWNPPPDENGNYALSHIVRQDGNMYLVRWVGWGTHDDTWEDPDIFERGSQETLNEWDELKQRIAARAVEMRKRRKSFASRASARRSL